jgi:hypothetical protein
MKGLRHEVERRNCVAILGRSANRVEIIFLSIQRKGDVLTQVAQVFFAARAVGMLDD